LLPVLAAAQPNNVVDPPLFFAFGSSGSYAAALAVVVGRLRRAG
jgi:hypothetical protein